MKKFVSALALAAVASPSAQALDFQIGDETALSIYGNIQVAYYSLDTGDDSVDDFADNGTTLGFDVEQEFSDNLIGFMRLEEDGFDAVDSGVTNNKTDEAYLGIKGASWGLLQFGRDDSLYDDAIGDYWDYQEVFTPTTAWSTTNNGDENTERALKYYSPDFGGFDFGFEAGFTADSDQPLGVDDSGDPVQDAAGDDVNFASLAAMASYTIADFKLTGSIDQRASDYIETEDGPNYLDNPVYGVVLSYSPADGPFSLDVGYQLDDREDDEGGEIGIASLGGRVNYGMGDVYGVIQNIDYDQERAGGEDSFNEFALGANFVVGSNMYVYVESVMLDREDDKGDTVSTGGIFYF